MLFDTGALHLFISRALRAKHAFTTKAIGRAITLTTLEGKRIRYKFCLEFKDIRLNILRGLA
jgi:hypothetical protein